MRRKRWSPRRFRSAHKLLQINDILGRWAKPNSTVRDSFFPRGEA